MTQDTAPPAAWADLLSAARAGDAQALGEVCERLRDFLLRAATRGLGDPLRAKVGASDVVQRTFLDAQQDIARFAGSSEEEFRAWLLKLVKHNLIDMARRYRLTQQRDASREVSIDAGRRQWEVAGSQKTPSSLISRRETDEALLRAVAQLPERRRRIIELRHRQGLCFAEIARQLELTEAAARKLWSRTVEELRSELSREYGKPPTRPR